MTNRDIPVFIISYNRLSYLQQLFEWLERAGFEDIHIVDNASTYLPLLTFLGETKHHVHRLEKNFGHLAVWECGRFDAILRNQNYIVTDCDVLPVEECPYEVTEYFESILKKFPDITKVGFSLKIDDLPERFAFRDSVVEWEQQFWQKLRGEGLFKASIDTTFALYRPNIYPSDKRWWKSIRTDRPYSARHLPWYIDTASPSEEEKFYQSQLKNRSTFWSVTDPELLKKYQQELLFEWRSIEASWRYLFLRLVYRLLFYVTRQDSFGRKMMKKSFDFVTTYDVRALQRTNLNILRAIDSIKKSDLWRWMDNGR